MATVAQPPSTIDDGKDAAQSLLQRLNELYASYLELVHRYTKAQTLLAKEMSDVSCFVSNVRREFSWRERQLSINF